MNEIELQFIKKLFDDNILFINTKVKIEMLNDPLCRTLFYEIGNSITVYGEFIPYHLNKMILDAERMEKYKKLNYPLDINTVEDIKNYIDKFETSKSIKSIESTIIDDYNRIKLYNISEMLTEDLNNSKRKTKEIINKYSHEIDKLLLDDSSLICSSSAYEFVDEELKNLENGNKDIFYKTGFNFLDSYSGGVSKPTFVCLGAPKKFGKSMFLYKITNNMLLQGLNVLFCTIEIDSKQCRRKILSLHTKTKYKKIFSQEFNENEKEVFKDNLKKFQEDYGDKLFIYQNKSGVSTKEIEAYCKLKEKSGIKIDVVCVDYLSIMKDVNSSTSTPERIFKIVEELRIMKEKLGVMLFTAQQISEGSAHKDIEDMDVSDIYYAKSIGYEADAVAIMANNKNNEKCIKVVANRLGIDSEYFLIQDSDLECCDLGIDIEFDNFQF